MSPAALALYALALLFVGLGAYLLGRRAAVPAPLAPPPAATGPDTSPQPWIAEEVWAQRHQWERFGNLRGPEDTEGPLLDAEVVMVTEADQLRAPILPFRNPPTVPRNVDQSTGDRLLRQTPEVGAFFRAARWPVCCSSLSVIRLVQPTPSELAAFEGKAGALDNAVIPEAHLEGWRLELASIRAGGRAVNGVNVFQCTACRRAYGVYSVP